MCIDIYKIDNRLFHLAVVQFSFSLSHDALEEILNETKLKNFRAF